MNSAVLSHSRLQNLNWFGFFVSFRPNQMSGKKLARMSLLMIRLYALNAFATDFFLLFDVRIEWRRFVSNPEKSENANKHICEFRFLLLAWFRNIRNDIYSPHSTVFNCIDAVAKQTEPQQKWTKSEHLLAAKRFIIIRNGSTNAMGSWKV